MGEKWHYPDKQNVRICVCAIYRDKPFTHFVCPKHGQTHNGDFAKLKKVANEPFDTQV